MDAAHELSPELATHRLADEPYLGRPRFVPRPGPADELLSSTLTWWNLLDSQMYEHANGREANFQAGYLRELQLRRMLQLAREPQVKTYCEIGMNGGHSLCAMLLANPALRAHVFDLFAWSYSWPIARLINTTFAGRVIFHAGHSQQTLRAFRREAKNTTTCDLVLVDGGHSEVAVKSDIRNLRHLASARTRVVIDDIGLPGPQQALRSLNASGVLAVREAYGPYMARSQHNPCMRVPPGTSLKNEWYHYNMCPEWGFAVVSIRPKQPPSLQPPPESPPQLMARHPWQSVSSARRAWTVHRRLNCYRGAGAYDIERGSQAAGASAAPSATSLAVSTMDEAREVCKRQCEAQPGCDGITLRRSSSRRHPLSSLPSLCYLRAKLNMSLCRADSRFDTWRPLPPAQAEFD